MRDRDRPFLFRCLSCIVIVALLGGCHSLFGSDSDHDKYKVAGKRIPVLESAKQLEADKGVADTKIEIPEAVQNSDYPQSGGNAEHTYANLALAAIPKKIWRVDVGDGSNGDFKLLARPVVSDGRIFTMDARGDVSAFSTAQGDKIWDFDTTPEDRDVKAMGGGLGVDSGVLYVTTGFGEVLALKTKEGSVIWRTMVGKPLRAPPTIEGGRVFVVTIDNELDALSTANGEILWHHNGIAESATLMGASSPAVSGDGVVVTYSSGEVFNLRVQNGRVAWTDVLATPAQVGALPAIADIRGNPVVDHGVVYAVSHSGRMAAIDMRTGDREWDADIGGTNTPVVAENAVFVLSNDNELIALTRQSGRIIWIRELQKLKDPNDHDSDRVFWYGPILAGGKLWLTNSLGHMVAYSATDGNERVDEEFDRPFFMPPIVAGGVIYALSDDGKLTALK
jgi:outer membrane protein assembly factor BamB